jgi:hypothetical protein
MAPQDVVALIPEQRVSPAIPLKGVRAPEPKESVITARVLFARHRIPVEEPET